MELRFYKDPDTGQPHIYGHGVTEQEVEEVLRGCGGRLARDRELASEDRPNFGRPLLASLLRA